MKAISVRQPWADLIIDGRKSIHLRSQKINYRGKLAIHASQAIEEEACKLFDKDPDLLTVGAIIGTVRLVDVSAVDKALYQDMLEDHLGQGNYRDGLFAWKLEHAVALPEAIPYRGRQGVFTVPDDLETMTTDAQPIRETKYKAFSPWNPEKPFELRVIPDRGKSGVPYRLLIYHPIIKSLDQQKIFFNQEAPKLIKVVELGGGALRAVADQIIEVLRVNDYKPTDLDVGRKEPFFLDEVSGVRLGLLFLAIKPISKFERIEQISGGLRLMTVEELYYWYSKCTAAPEERGQKALRVLLSDD
jgi:hypothetical protein